MVGVEGFELSTSSSQSWRSTRLSYTPIAFRHDEKSIAECAKKSKLAGPIASKPPRRRPFFLPHRAAMRIQKEKGAEAPFANLARPERFELPTTKFVAWYSIQLSYGREEAELLGLQRTSSTLF